MHGIIEQTKPSQSGKTLGVLIGGQWYSTKHFELGQRLGEQINFSTSSTDYNGSVIHWLNDYSEMPLTPSAQAFNQAQVQAPQAAGPIPPTPPVEAYSGTPVPGSGQMAPQQAPQKPQIDTQCSIIAQALTKACSGQGDDVAQVWSRYCSFYRFALKGVPDTYETQGQERPAPDGFDDEIPF